MPERFALIVANDIYEHGNLSRLRAPAHDAEALEEVLADPDIGCFQVTVIRNQPSYVIRREIANFLADRKPDDFLLLHFSCHGIKTASGDLYLAGTDTVPTRLSATAVPAQFVNQEMADSRARQVVLLLDCCYGAAFSHGLRARGDGIDVERSFPLQASPGTVAPNAADVKGRVVITASSALEYAFEDDRFAEVGTRSPSVFTSALVHGLATGEADTGGDGLVDVDELYEYVHARVRSTTHHQTPHKWADVQGTIVIGWAPPATRLQSAVLPADLAARVRDPLPGVRLAAVADLRRILLDQDLERAVGALDLLRQLTGDDSKEVSGAATATLEEAQLKALPERIEFPGALPGQLEQPPDSRTIRLVGPPLARVLHTATSARWLRLEHSQPTAEHGAWVVATLDRAAMPEERGELHGSISVANRIGTLEIQVTAHGTGRLWARSPSIAPTAVPSWVRSPSALFLVAACLVAAWLATANAILRDSTMIGLGYYFIRAALLFAGITLLTRQGKQRAVGCGITAASVSYFLTDAVGSLNTTSGALNWLEFFAVAVFTALLAMRLWPFPALPRRASLVAPGNRPLPWAVLAAAAAEIFMLFVSVPNIESVSVTLEDSTGILGGLLAVIPVSGLCVAVALVGANLAQQKIFAAAAILAYLCPEVYFMLSSLLLGTQYTYLGDDVGGPGLTAGWFVVAQAAIACTLGISTLLLLQGTAWTIPKLRAGAPPGGRPQA
jgi:Caspase domain